MTFPADHRVCPHDPELIGSSRHFGQSKQVVCLRRFALCRAERCSMSPNRVLSRLSPTDFTLLEPHLEAVDLPVRRQLEVRNKRVAHVYFIESGVASVVANGERNIEVGIIGREGMTGLSVVMGSDAPARNETYMQMAGNGQCMSAANLRDAIAASVTLHRVLLLFAHSFMIQTTQTALANGRSKIEERLARWLLMAADRVDGKQLALTQEFLATMLGTARPGVTIAIQELERTGLVAHRRGFITILDRDGLEKHSNGTYLPPEKS
jgi:CRP-like cAMP-binding protein